MQGFGSAVLIGLVPLAFDVDALAALAAALALAMSSTAIGLAVPSERNLMGTGQVVLSVA